MESFVASLHADTLRVALLEHHAYTASEAGAEWAAHAREKAEAAWARLQEAMTAILAAPAHRAAVAAEEPQQIAEMVPF